MSQIPLRDHRSAPSLPVTAVAWTSSASTCPRDFTLITTTEEGASAQFGRGFGKSGYYLCYSMKTEGGMMVSDLQVISDKETTPHGYCYVPEYLEHKASVWRKKRMCVRIVPLGSMETAVLDIKLTTKSKAKLPYYTCLGEVNGLVMWCRRGVFSGPAPTVKPRSVSLDIRSLSLDQPTPPKRHHSSSGPPGAGQGKLSHRRGNLHNRTHVENISENSLNSPSVMDGIPFALHPKFESQNGSAVSSDNLNIRIKTVHDIESEYNYVFSVEEKAAKRDPPRTSPPSSSSTRPPRPPLPSLPKSAAGP